jgi:hypothetical protein
MDCEEMSPELRLAAIVTLLSACALRGTTANKAAALRVHLEAATRTDGLGERLCDAIEQALRGWEAIECHPESISVHFCPLTVPGQSLH